MIVDSERRDQGNATLIDSKTIGYTEKDIEVGELTKMNAQGAALRVRSRPEDPQLLHRGDHLSRFQAGNETSSGRHSIGLSGY